MGVLCCVPGLLENPEGIRQGVFRIWQQGTGQVSFGIQDGFLQQLCAVGIEVIRTLCQLRGTVFQLCQSGIQLSGTLRSLRCSLCICLQSVYECADLIKFCFECGQTVRGTPGIRQLCLDFFIRGQVVLNILFDEFFFFLLNRSVDLRSCFFCSHLGIHSPVDLGGLIGSYFS